MRLSSESHGEPPPLDRVVSGGQTGVDRAALDAAIGLGIQHGGWCPQGRRAEDGRIPDGYQLTETDSPDYALRTERNVVDSDGTLILYCAELRGGTLLTYQLAQKHAKAHLLVDLNQPHSAETVRRWLAEQAIRVLNVAGPREGQNDGIYRLARLYLESVLGTA